jgi:hypothetical protein
MHPFTEPAKPSKVVSHRAPPTTFDEVDIAMALAVIAAALVLVVGGLVVGVTTEADVASETSVAVA